MMGPRKVDQAALFYEFSLDGRRGLPGRLPIGRHRLHKLNRQRVVSLAVMPFVHPKPSRSFVQRCLTKNDGTRNTGLTMSQQKPNGLVSLGRWTAKA